MISFFGSYYQGQMNDVFFHGKGKYVNSDGTIQEGIWDEHDFKGPAFDPEEEKFKSLKYIED